MDATHSSHIGSHQHDIDLPAGGILVFHQILEDFFGLLSVDQFVTSVLLGRHRHLSDLSRGVLLDRVVRLGPAYKTLSVYILVFSLAMEK